MIDVLIILKCNGIIFHACMQWSHHILSTCSKANISLNFLHRNLNKCSRNVKENAYLTIIFRPSLEYTAWAWDPYHEYLMYAWHWKYSMSCCKVGFLWIVTIAVQQIVCWTTLNSPLYYREDMLHNRISQFGQFHSFNTTSIIYLANTVSNPTTSSTPFHRTSQFYCIASDKFFRKAICTYSKNMEQLIITQQHAITTERPFNNLKIKNKF